MKNLLFAILLFLSASAFSQNDGWNITTTSSKNYTGIVLANGRIGMLPSATPFEIKRTILSNVYDREKPLDVSKVLLGMNFGNLDIEIDGEKITETNISDWKQTLSLKEARLTTSFSFKNKATVSYDIYALRNVPYAGYIDISIHAKELVQVKVTGKILIPAIYKNPLDTFSVSEDNETTLPILQSVAKTAMEKYTIATSAAFIWHDINSTKKSERPQLTHTKVSDYDNELSFEMEIKKNTSLDFAWAGAECTSKDFSDPHSESERFITLCLLTPRDVIVSQHKTLWDKLWEGDIVIEGDLPSQQDVRLALYHLYSFGKEGSNQSISPMGLSSQGYYGHVFWDSEIWMYPPLLVLNQDIAKSLINYRSDRLYMAEKKANNFGYKGAMYPWESDETGEESTPVWALTGTFEHHITADVGIAAWNYYRVTKDKTWLTERGYPMLKEIADYWVSRISKNTDGSYSIRNVVGADEFAPNVDDNAFTNGAAITALKFAVLAAKELGVADNPSWKAVADNIKIHKFPDGTTMEYSKYKGDTIKQADVNLLTYPLDVVNDKDAIMKDLKYYEPRLAADGPAMGKCIFAVIYARLGDAEKAYQLFKESYEPNKRPPFGALAESAGSNNPYFATGAGGMLQTVLFGFGGLYFTENGIVQINPVLPKEWKSLTIKGVGLDKKTYEVKK